MNEERFAKEMKKIQSVVSRALQKANTLAVLVDGGKMSREKLQLTLEETAYFFEAATLHLRALCETQMPGIGGYGRRDGLEFQLPSGHIEIAGAGWVHMQLDTLLPDPRRPLRVRGIRPAGRADRPVHRPCHRLLRRGAQPVTDACASAERQLPVSCRP